MGMERYGHGGDWLTANEVYGKPADGWLDFSANMNPWGPPEIVGTLMKERWREIARYPDPAVRGLRRKLAEAYGIPEESILAGNGAAELIDLAVRVQRPEEIVLARPSFSEYEDAVRKAGSRVREAFLREDEGFELRDPEPFASRAVFLGHPNNPTGRLIPQPFLERLWESGSNLLLDEAFIDFSPDEHSISWIRRAAESDRVLVIRSMTKFYAMPGIRLGFLAAHPDRIRRMAAQQTPWSVNFLAQMIGEAVLDESEYAERTRAWLQEERPWLVGGLRSLGLTVYPGDANYLLFSLRGHAGWDAARLQRAMAEKGILVRDASRFAGLDSSYIRVAIRLRQDNERLLKALKECLT
ncbi:threonine-phosphate decarboxylase CobD [Cohnella caldifontis]|uniref:threonine-phosphate decarboxylase CobD n=1 Tax=Cohnella caldifontis TaxID=3027471 RepID=UPI0023EBCA39|nr:threonine-phosphate decarboxylase CobD [Cohnella sp. YIM B05605]